MSTDKQIASLIRRHGTNDPICSTAIEKAVGCTGATVRHAVARLRVECFPIGSGQRGYWWAKNTEELVSTARHLQSRVAKIARVHRGVKRAMAELTAKQGRML